MELYEVYLRQINEKLEKQLINQEFYNSLQKEQVELLKEINKTNKDMENYIKGLNGGSKSHTQSQ